MEVGFGLVEGGREASGGAEEGKRTLEGFDDFDVWRARWGVSCEEWMVERERGRKGGGLKTYNVNASPPDSLLSAGRISFSFVV